MPFDGNSNAKWLWVRQMVEQASTGSDGDCASIAEYLKPRLNSLEFLLTAYDEYLWGTTWSTPHLVVRDPPYGLYEYNPGNPLFQLAANEPLIMFNPSRLRDILIGPGGQAKDMLALLPSSGIGPLWPEEKHAHIDGKVVEAVFRLICAASQVLTIPLKASGDQGIDALSILPSNGRLVFASIDSKSSSQGWNLTDQCTRDGAWDRIMAYRDSAKSKFSEDVEMLIWLAALCLRSRTEEDRSKIDWRFFGGFAWPRRGGESKLTLRFSREWSSDELHSRSLKKVKAPPSQVNLTVQWDKAIISLRTILDRIVWAEKIGLPHGATTGLELFHPHSWTTFHFLEWHRVTKLPRLLHLRDFRNQ